MTTRSRTATTVVALAAGAIALLGITGCSVSAPTSTTAGSTATTSDVSVSACYGLALSGMVEFGFDYHKSMMLVGKPNDALHTQSIKDRDAAPAQCAFLVNQYNASYAVFANRVGHPNTQADRAASKLAEAQFAAMASPIQPS